MTSRQPFRQFANSAVYSFPKPKPLPERHRNVVTTNVAGRFSRCLEALKLASQASFFMVER